MNPDRSPQNPNLLAWHGQVWLIDHGAALYVHHTWRDVDSHARRPFERLRDHLEGMTEVGDHAASSVPGVFAATARQ